MTNTADTLILEFADLEVRLITGIYTEEKRLPQPLRISMRVGLRCPERFEMETPLTESKNYMDLKHAATAALPEGKHFVLIEAIADHIADTLMMGDERVLWVEVKIVKLAIAEANEKIGMTLTRHRR